MCREAAGSTRGAYTVVVVESDGLRTTFLVSRKRDFMEMSEIAC